jgi:hypothetical protein
MSFILPVAIYFIPFKLPGYSSVGVLYFSAVAVDINDLVCKAEKNRSQSEKCRKAYGYYT